MENRFAANQLFFIILKKSWDVIQNLRGHQMLRGCKSLEIMKSFNVLNEKLRGHKKAERSWNVEGS